MVKPKDIGQQKIDFVRQTRSREGLKSPSKTSTEEFTDANDGQTPPRIIIDGVEVSPITPSTEDAPIDGTGR